MRQLTRRTRADLRGSRQSRFRCCAAVSLGDRCSLGLSVAIATRSHARTRSAYQAPGSQLGFHRSAVFSV